MTNIDLFNRVTLTVFDRLYSSFPSPINLSVADIALSVVPEKDNLGEENSSLYAVGDAIDFLAKEGFLTHMGIYMDGSDFLRARLTLKGLTILGTPTSLEEKRSLIDNIRSALASGAKESGAETIKLLTQAAFSSALAAGPALLSKLHV